MPSLRPPGDENLQAGVYGGGGRRRPEDAHSDKSDQTAFIPPPLTDQGSPRDLWLRSRKGKRLSLSLREASTKRSSFAWASFETRNPTPFALPAPERARERAACTPFTSFLPGEGSGHSLSGSLAGRREALAAAGREMMIFYLLWGCRVWDMCVCNCMCVHMCASVYLYVCACVYLYVCACVYLCVLCVYCVCLYVCACVYSSVCMCILMCTCMWVHMHTHVRACLNLEVQ
uniref:Uncharacterized protein n=1 Tax=Molossus molossus TaxID=27622 RepID=A0A7J8BYK2_MOLMO|nr:hypothetical protein HJG59_010075 [Molossus molossus]